MSKKRIKKQYRAIVKHYTDGTFKITPIDPSNEVTWGEFNEELKGDQDKRIPRAEAFLRAQHFDVPGTPVPDRLSLLSLATDRKVYAGSLRIAAKNLGMLHVIQVLDSEETGVLDRDKDWV